VHITRHLEGCKKHNTSKDAFKRVISKDARPKASRRMHIERKPEGCATRSPGKGNPESTYTSRSNAKYFATLHPGRARLKASQLINTLALFASCSMGNIYKQILKSHKTNSYKPISRPEP